MGYVISKTGFGDLPRANLQIDHSGYNLTVDSIVEGDDSYSIMWGADIGAPDDYRQNSKYLVYTGTASPGQTVQLPRLTLLFRGKAKDSSDKRYDVRISYLATLEFPSDFNAQFISFASCTSSGILQIVSSRGTYPSNIHSIEGTAINFTVTILDNGTPVTESTLFAVADIDVYDMMNVMYGDGQRYGVDNDYVLPYQEQVRPAGTVLSPIYMEPDTLIITNAQHTIFGGSAGTTSRVAASIAYLAETPIQVTFALSDGAMELFTQASDFAKFTIVSSAGSGGRISPNGSNDYNYNTTGIYNISPDYGYEIEDVKVDGVSVGPVSSYTFSNIKADHTIHVDFVNVIPPCRRPMGDMNICGESKLYIPEDCEDETS